MSLAEVKQRIQEAETNNYRQLDLSDLALNEIPEEIYKYSDSIVRLDFRKNKLTNIDGLEQLPKLRRLWIPYNKFQELTGLEKLSKLEVLDAMDNNITRIEGLDKLTQLDDLRVGRNELSDLPGIEKLTELTRLDISGNHISHIRGFENLTKLEWLFAYRNEIEDISPLADLTNLEYLFLLSNKLTDISSLKKLTKLKLLWISSNQLTEFPEFLLKLDRPIVWENSSSEKKICAAGNPFTDPPPEVIKRGNEAIREYFEQKGKGSESLNEAKLILLGDGRSGKTSLANRLLKKELPKEEDRTKGVDIVIGKYSFPMANGEDFKLNIWDFAGQDKYKTLHQLFYTESSLYVMVAESGNMTTDFDDWFQTASLFGEGSPLILILNEFREGIGMGSFDVKQWKKQFPELLKEVITVNLRTKDNFENAEKFIQFLAQTLPHTKYAFPSNWAAIRRVLNERRDEQYISLKEYLKICTENNLPERESALVLSSVLHKVGDCLHYQKSDLLNQFIILKNEWATDAVYKILDDPVVAEEKRGFFDPADLKRIWKDHEYADMRPQLLELMKQFKLAYQLPGKEEYVTPPLLPPGRPTDFDWPELDSLELYIDYDFLPKALLTQFIVSRHADIARERTLVWRNGVVLEWPDEALAEVHKTKLKGKDAFYIRTQGDNRKGMMTVIIRTFRELYLDYSGIRYEEKVPCPCSGCSEGLNEQHYFFFSNLKRRLEKGRIEVECDKSLETLNVLDLLENTFVLEKYKDNTMVDLKDVDKKSVSQRVLNIFLASSYELKPERDAIEQAIARKNDALREKGFYIDLRIWEDGKHVGKSIRTQDDYNLEIQECEFFVLLFYSKMGGFSLEEFNTARNTFEKNELPRIRVFQKDVDLPKDLPKKDSDSRYAFLDLLNDIGTFPDKFHNTDNLLNQLDDLIDKLLDEDDFTKRLKG